MCTILYNDPPWNSHSPKSCKWGIALESGGIGGSSPFFTFGFGPGPPGAGRFFGAMAWHRTGNAHDDCLAQDLAKRSCKMNSLYDTPAPPMCFFTDCE